VASGYVQSIITLASVVANLCAHGIRGTPTSLLYGIPEYARQIQRLSHPDEAAHAPFRISGRGVNQDSSHFTVFIPGCVNPLPEGRRTIATLKCQPFHQKVREGVKHYHPWFNVRSRPAGSLG
jgi:hypothetical protein